MEKKDLNKSKKKHGLNHDHDGYHDDGDDYDKEEYNDGNWNDEEEDHIEDDDKYHSHDQYKLKLHQFITLNEMVILRKF